MEKLSLDGDSVRLRSPEMSDVDVLYRMENDESLWDVSCNNAPYSRHQLVKYIEESVHDLFAEHQIRFIIEYQDNVAGCIDLTDIDAVQSHAMVGIAVLPEYRHLGIAGAALGKLCDYAVNRLRLHQLAAIVPVCNEYSHKLFLSAGFSQSGRMNDWMWTCNGYADVLLLQKIF